MLHDVSAKLVHSVGETAIHRVQEVPDEYLAHLADKRHASHGVREKDYMHVASIPVALVESWMRDGFNVYTAPVKEIVARLRKENLTAFMATDKRV